MYSRPNREDPIDRLAHYLSEIDNDQAPIGWERYRFMAGQLLDKFGLTAAVMAADLEPLRS